MRAVPRRAPRGEALAGWPRTVVGRGGHIGAVGGCGVDAASFAGSATLSRQIDRIRPGAATNMITSAMMNTSRSNGIPDWIPIDLPPDVSAPNSSAATHDAARPEAGQQGERDRGEPDAAGQVGRELADGADDQERARRGRPGAPDRAIASIIEPPALMPA